MHPWRVTIVIRDHAKKTKMNYCFNPAAPTAEAEQHALAVIAALDKCINGVIVGASLSIYEKLYFGPPGWPFEEPPEFLNSDVEAKARVDLWQTNPPPIGGVRNKWHHWLHTFDEGLTFRDYVMKWRQVDALFSEEVQALINFYSGARALGHPYNTCDKRGREADAAFLSRFQWRKK